jgi:regulation of enolase protein 1 (concanavalin A-like superfamily)
MLQDQHITIPALSKPLRWQGIPQNWSADSDSNLSITAGRKTDWFLDPGGSVNVLNAPALLATVDQPCMLKALVTSGAAATFDAAVLTVYQADDQWAKLCFELSPQGQLMIVSVVTKGTSDDCNSIPVNGSSVYLRLSVLEKAYAFHYSLDGKLWNMVRYFTLGERQRVEIGFLSQSPTGEGCTAIFSEIALIFETLSDIRSGI